MAESNKANLGGDSMKGQLHQQPDDVPPDNVAIISGGIREISQEQADDMLRNLREHIILMTMFNHFEDVDNIDLNGKDGWDAIKAKASWDTNVLNALGIIAGAYIETHGGTDAITIASGKSFVPTPEAEADLLQWSTIILHSTTAAGQNRMWTRRSYLQRTISIWQDCPRQSCTGCKPWPVTN